MEVGSEQTCRLFVVQNLQSEKGKKHIFGPMQRQLPAPCSRNSQPLILTIMTLPQHYPPRTLPWQAMTHGTSQHNKQFPAHISPVHRHSATLREVEGKLGPFEALPLVDEEERLNVPNNCALGTAYAA